MGQAMPDFDVVLDRRGSTKWDKYRDTDVLPMWIADMDFNPPAAVIDQIQSYVATQMFGYADPPSELIYVVLNYLEETYAWQVNADDLLFIPGVVSGLNVACRGLVAPGETLLTATPIYYPFLDVPKNMDRELIRLPVDMDRDYRYPVYELEAAITPDSRMLLLCNPFNPVGRVLTPSELGDIVSLCLEHDLLICSDEIHCQLIFDDRQHIPVAKVDSRIEENLVTLMGPGKTYNMAGIGGGVAIIKNPAMREKFAEASEGIMGSINVIAYQAMLAAYRDGEPWRMELIRYLQNNRDYLAQRIRKIPGISMNPVEATYLAWLDVRPLALEDPLAFFESAGVGLSDGAQFAGPGFMRLNFACPRAILTEACDRIERAVS
ncbi:MAG: aspartate aminotransferase [Deltaproteobacteria bacterium]|nr:aspartate aminotransferase [Deltaproteobacteria bacterium]